MSFKHPSAPKANIQRVADPAFKPIAGYWGTFDWHLIVTHNYPDLKLKFEDNKADWTLYLLIDLLAKETGIDFVDAASWILCRVLGRRVNYVRRMAKAEIPWVPEFQYTCRVVAVNVCKLFDPNITHTLSKVDQMIWHLLITEDELLAEATTANRVPC